MLLQSIIPYLPTSISEIWIFIVTGLSTILLVYAVFVEKEHRQDLMRLIGTIGLLAYAIYIYNLVFIIAMGAIAIASLIEFVEIMTGLHKHSPEDLQRYKKFVRTKHIERNNK